LNRAQARFEQAAARIGERLGLGGRSLRQELRERRQQTAEPAARQQTPAGIEVAPVQPQRAADEGLPLEARWKAATAAEFRAVRDKAQRTMALAEKREAVIAKKLKEIKRAEPAKPGWFSLPGAKDRYKRELPEWTKERDSLVAALNRTRQRGAKAREFTEEAAGGNRSPGEQLAEQRYPELAKAIQAGQEQQKRERLAAIRQKLEQQRERSRERGGRGR
jgi:hypothetical protein